MPALFIVCLAALALGLILFFVWFAHIAALLKATVAIAFIVGGAVAAYLGWEELRDRKNPNIDFSSPDEASRYKAEARVYQAEINEIKEGQAGETAGNQPGPGEPD
jgi:membrane protein implicated in regulation of membrane protease activity